MRDSISLFEAAATAEEEGRLLDAARLYSAAAALSQSSAGQRMASGKCDRCLRVDEIAKEIEPAFPFIGSVVRVVLIGLDGDRQKADALLAACAGASIDPRDVLTARRAQWGGRGRSVFLSERGLPSTLADVV